MILLLLLLLVASESLPIIVALSSICTASPPSGTVFSLRNGSLYPIAGYVDVREVACMPFSTNVSYNFSEVAQISLVSLQKDYEMETGLWNTTGWWNAANCLTMLADYGLAEPTMDGEVLAIIQNSYEKANAQAMSRCTKYIKPVGVGMRRVGERERESIEEELANLNLQAIPYDKQPAPAGGKERFINDFYDDEAWWALAWIRAFDLTRNVSYLITAAEIFDDLVGGQKAPCGGIWWNKAHDAEVAISNSLFIETAAALASRQSHIPTSYRLSTPSHPRDAYLAWAFDSWTWFLNSGLLNAHHHLVNDGLTTDCKNNNGTEWTYNQGALISALVELHGLLELEIFLTTAHRIANATMAFLTDKNGILHEPCEPNCSGDGTQFKGVFMRGLARLHGLDPRKEYADFIRFNAISIVKYDRNCDGQMSVSWAGPFINPANASTQCAAMDAIVAAVGNAGRGKKTGVKMLGQESEHLV